MPSPKTNKRVKLLYVLCHCRITVYALANEIPLARIVQTFSRGNKFLKFFRKKYTDLVSAVNKQAEKMLTGSQQKQNKRRCKSLLKDNSNASVLFYSPEKNSLQLQDKFNSTIDKAVQRAISIVRRLKKIMQPGSMPRLLFGMPVNFGTRDKLEGLKISAQEELLISKRMGLLRSLC